MRTGPSVERDVESDLRVGDLRFEDSDQQTAGERQTERAEVADQGAAASAGTTSNVRLATSRPDRLTMRIAASAARTPPSAQLAVATRSGEIPCADVALRFSATAWVDRPNVVQR